MTDCFDSCSVGSSDHVTWIIPGMNFSCAGTITGWQAGAHLDTSSSHGVNAILSIWRQSSQQPPGTYVKVATIELGTCGNGVESRVVPGMSRVYECSLPESLRVSFQPGDIIGIEVAHSSSLRFGLLFDNSNRDTGPTSYVFDGAPSSIMLNQRDYTSPGDQPQISLTVEMTTEALITTQLPPQTTTKQVSTTETPETSTVATTAVTTSIPESPTSQEPTTASPVQPIRFCFPLGLFIAPVVGGLLVLALLITITFVSAYLIGRYCKVTGESGGGLDGVPRGVVQNHFDTGDMEYNEAYIPVKFTIKENISYGQKHALVEKQDVADYDTIDVPAVACEVSIRSEPNLYSTIA